MLLARLKKITEIVEMTLSFDSFRLVTRYIWLCLPWSRTSGPVSRPISIIKLFLYPSGAPSRLTR